MRIETDRFGTIEIDSSSIITLEDGMIGMPRLQRFTLIQHREGSTFYWLQSLDEPATAFVVVNPLHFFPDYEVDVSEEVLSEIAVTDTDAIALLAVLTVGNGGHEVTANLLGPLLINTDNRTGVQCVLNRKDLHTRHVVVNEERAAELAPGPELARDLEDLELSPLLVERVRNAAVAQPAP